MLTLIFISLLIFADWSSVICYRWLIVWIIIRDCFALIANYSWTNNDCLSLKSIIKGYHLFVINGSCSLTNCHWLIIIHYVSKNQVSLIDYPGLIVIGWFSSISHRRLFISDEFNYHHWLSLIDYPWLILPLSTCHSLFATDWLNITDCLSLDDGRRLLIIGRLCLINDCWSILFDWLSMVDKMWFSFLTINYYWYNAVDWLSLINE